jgi:hypothetical protein
MMKYSVVTRRSMSLVVTAALAFGAGRHLYGQGRAGEPPAGPPPTATASAPIDLTGYWVSVITEDWRWRMVTPPKGDYASIPITPEAKQIADAWDPAKDEAAGEACKSYGGAAIMRVPGRLHITWQDDNTLKVETDAGMQTRLLHFGGWKAPPREPTWPGNSVAEWEMPGRAGGRGPARGGGAAEQAGQPRFGHLKVVTTHMRPGYLRKNGVPYSVDAVMTEHWEVYKERNGTQWLVITTLIDDPKYLQQQYVTSPNFKKEPDGSKWDPTPCSARW